MKKSIKLLLLAALAWPAIAMAQGQPEKVEKTTQPVQVEKISSAQDESTQPEVFVKALDLDCSPRNHAKVNRGPQKAPVINNNITIAEGSVTNNGIPIYGYYYDNYYASYYNNAQRTRSQMIYPADMLTDLVGEKIQSLTFYAPDGIQFGNTNGTSGQLTIQLGECDADYFMNNNMQSFSGTTVSGTVTPKKGAKSFTVEFSSPFTYKKGNNNEGKNLLVDVVVSTAGTADDQNTNFVGISTDSEQSIMYFRNGSNRDQYSMQKFLPTVTFGLVENITSTTENIDFGTVTCGGESAAKSVTITNNNSNDVNLSWEFTGTFKDKFSTNVTATTIPAGGSVTFPIVFKPGTTAGTMTSNLVITSHLTTYRVYLQGKGVAARDANVTPTTVDFGEVLVGGTYTATVKVTSTGILSITPTFTQPRERESAFEITGTTGELIPGAEREYTVTFKPTDEESYSSSFKIKYDTYTDSEGHINSNEHTVTLRGKGVTTVPLQAAPSPLAFGQVTSSQTKDVTLTNINANAVTANLSISPENGPFSIANTTVTVNGNDGTVTVPVTFNPTNAASYTGTLVIDVDGHVTRVPLTGVFNKSGEIATRDSAFFAGIEYSWPINVNEAEQKKSTLDQIATDPDQIIAMLRKVYMDKNIPGNYYRGYDEDGNLETNNVANYNVQYTGAGTIVRTGDTSASYDNTYGWDIPGDIKVPNGQTSNNYRYWYMDPEQYRPDQEGVTLLLLEMVDDFNPNFIEIVAQSGYEQLREYVAKTIKSARVVTEAKRTGSTSDKSSGTLFKIDCDKMNKFYLIAKGQLQWMRSVMFETTSTLDFYREPCYIYRYNYNDKYVDPAINRYFFLGHMFEQFSPVIADGTEAKSDVYNLLVTQMSSFGVDHDCPNVPFVSNGHHFMMYGDDWLAADCQDVRDMVFFVPDYRMMNHPNRGLNGLTTTSGTSYKTQDYFKYHPDHQPTMGIYVIKQDPVTGAKVDNKELYKLKLTWKSNMDDFLPSDQQEYQLYQVVTDDFGDQTYVPVYYRNDKGEYTDKDGNPVGEANKVPVVLTMGATSAHEYENVYIDQQTSGQTVTFAVRGQDADHFLSLQMSNEESFFIPGTDATEILHVTSATYYSRFEPQEVNNCYSNKIEVRSNDNSVRSSYIPNGTTFTINRKWNERVGENTVAHTDAVATATVQEGDIIKISINEEFQSPETMYPRGESEPDGRGAGYHANKVVTAEIDRETVNGVEYANFNFIIWDNFVVDVSENGHAGQYVYEVVFETPGNIDGTNSTHAHSNNFTVNVHKTDTKMSKPLTLDQVLNDTQCDDEYAPADVVEFQEQVRLNSKTNLLRYDAYRWDEGDTRYILDKVGQNDEEEEDVPPTGIAGNQGDYYSVSMNEIGTSYYDSGSNVAVNTTNPTNWATFVDKYPTMSSEAGAYTYAPVIELFSKGYASHDDSNSIKRMDYNTYGGPLQNTAVGKLKVSVKEPQEPVINPNTQEVEDYSLMSEHKWQDDNGVWYSYYNIYLNFEALGVPEGYKLYKVRAWRKVNKDDLGEQLETRKVRIPVDQEGNPKTDWYMYEDMNFGDPLDMSGDPNKLMGAQYFMERKHILGERSTKIGKPTNPDGTGGGSVFAHDDGEWVYGPDQEAAIRYEKRATFGAKRLTTDALRTDFYTLDASFKVRAYFTKESNPLINKFDELYVIGNEPKQEGQENAKWLPNKALATLVCRDGRSYVGTFTPNDAGDGYGYFSLTNKLSSDPNDWNQIANNRIQPEEKTKEVPASNVQLKYYINGENCFKAKAGKTYQLTLTNYEVSTVDGANAGVITVTELPSSSNAPRRAEAEQKSAYDYDYYVAEGETTFSITSNGSNIITGISGVKADVNREVVSVTYVNPLGQQSSRPFSGVNMVVTRYSDGSATTTKVVK